MSHRTPPGQRLRCIVATLLLIVLGSVACQAQGAAKGAVLTALEEEMGRARRILEGRGSPPPYFIGYQVVETRRIYASASYGALRTSSEDLSRDLDVTVRVGDYRLDNTHQVRGESGIEAFLDMGSVSIPVEDDLDALKSKVWLETDKRYKRAVERLIQVKGNRAIKVKEEDSSADFSHEAPVREILPSGGVTVDRGAWEAKLKEYSALFNRHAEIYEGEVGFTAEAVNKYLVNSEGSSIQHGTVHYRLSVVARTKAEDGMALYRYEMFDAHGPEKLPTDEQVRAAIAEVAADLIALRSAPVIEPYTGPAILSGRASGVFFHEIFGHRIEGHRQKDEEEGQTFTKKIGEQVLPEFISVHDDPTMKSMVGIDLNGYYRYDDEGTKAQRVTVVEKGVMRNFLMSRSPVQGFEHSNGHGRCEPGRKPIGRQGNLIVSAHTTVSEEKLRAMLIEECRKQGKPFGLIFKDISGGFTITWRGIPQSFQITPILVYRVYTDGRPDELVRGADLIGTPLTSFSRIIAAGERTEVFNGVCGAESGWVPVSGVSPSILTTQIEIQKKYKSADRLPVLPPPDKDNPY